MVKHKRGKLVAGIMALAVLLLMPGVSVQASGEAVSIPDVTVDVGETEVAPINITSITDLGTATIWLSYDKTVVEVNSVASGDMGTVTYAIYNDEGVTKMTWYDAEGVSCDRVFANVTLHAVGDSGDTSPLDLDVKEFIDTSFTPITPDVTDGTFTISGVPAALVADADGPYSGTAGVAVNLSGSATGGTPTYDYAWDLDNDGAYDDSTAQNPSHTWSTAGSYTVGLQVTDSASPANTDTDTASVDISEAGPPPVGGTIYPSNNLALLALWIGLGLVIVAGAIIFLRRRGVWS